MFIERTSGGLDVHARSVAAAIDSVTGEVFQARLTPSFEHIRSWIAELPGAVPGPIAVVYEAGPTASACIDICPERESDARSLRDWRGHDSCLPRLTADELSPAVYVDAPTREGYLSGPQCSLMGLTALPIPNERVCSRPAMLAP